MAKRMKKPPLTLFGQRHKEKKKKKKQEQAQAPGGLFGAVKVAQNMNMMMIKQIS